MGKNLRNNSRSSGDSGRGVGGRGGGGAVGRKGRLPGELGPVLMTFSFSGADCDEIARVLAGVNNGSVYYLLRELLGRHLVSPITGSILGRTFTEVISRTNSLINSPTPPLVIFLSQFVSRDP